MILLWNIKSALTLFCTSKIPWDFVIVWTSKIGGNKFNKYSLAEAVTELFQLILNCVTDQSY